MRLAQSFLKILFFATYHCRWKPLSFIHNGKSEYWSLSLGIGGMDEEEGVLDHGLMLGIYESGPWVGIKFPGNPSMAWIGGGTAEYDFMVRHRTHAQSSLMTHAHDLISQICFSKMFVLNPHCKAKCVQVWRHSCVSISRSTGRFMLVENGVVAADKVSQELVQWMETIPVEVSTVHIPWAESEF